MHRCPHCDQPCHCDSGERNNMNDVCDCCLLDELAPETNLRDIELDDAELGDLDE